MSFREKLTTGMPDHFTMPEEFLSLADWCEQQGYGISDVTFIADPDVHVTGDVKLFLGERGPFPDGSLPDPDRLYEVGYTGGDGSTFCLWLDDDGVQHVVNHGSGSASCLWATFPDALSVLRLFAVGYFTPAFNSEWGAPPELEGIPDAELSDSALAPYRAWLKERWGQDTPRTGVAALGLSDADAAVWTDVEGPTTGDPFNEWLTAGQ
jgi:hypothetical protein